jgi:hypothetical protein
MPLMIKTNEFEVATDQYYVYVDRRSDEPSR